MPLPAQRTLMSINGVAAYSGGRFDLGRFSALPRVRTTADFHALGRVVDAYQKAAYEQARKGDYDAALMANHLAAQYADYQTAMVQSTRDTIRSMQAYGDGRIDLAPGAYAILPAFDRYDAGRPQVSIGVTTPEEAPALALGDLDDGFAASPFPTLAKWPYGATHEVAQNRVDNTLRTINDVINATGMSAPAQQRPRTPAPRLDIVQAMSLPLNQPITLASGAVLERTADSFVLHNPKATPIQIDAKALGYLPPISTPSPARIAAGKILESMNSTLISLMLAHNQAAGTAIDIEPPAKILIGQRGTARKIAGLRIDGQLGITAEHHTEAMREYGKTGSPFRLAVTARYSMEQSREREEFRSQCLVMLQNVSSGYFLNTLEGAYGEVVNLRCARSRFQNDHEGETLYSRRYFVTDNGQIKSWESLLRDKDTAKQLEKMDRSNDAIENLVELLPFIGNAESGLKCADQPTLTRRIRELVSADARSLNQKRGFVSDIYSLEANSFSLDRAVSCASMLPLVGNAAKFGLKAAQLADLGRHADKFGKEFVAATGFLDAGIKRGSPWAQVSASMEQAFAGRNSAAAMKYARTAYDAGQGGMSLSELAQQI